MQLQIISMGNKMPNWVDDALTQYLVRVPQEYNFKITEIPLQKRTKNRDIAAIMQQEGEIILSKINPSDLIVTLEINGKNWSTEQLAKQLTNWQQNTKKVNFIIGGPEGLAPNVRAKSDIAWSLSNLTLPHPLARIIVVEQIYRALMILQNHPYHK